MKKCQKHLGLAQQNGFGPSFLHSLLLLVKGTSKALYLGQKSVITVIWLLFPVF
jgi:hypothetical protein